MKKLGIVITDGVGFRNFVLSKFLVEANSRFDKVIIYSFIPASYYEFISNEIKVREIVPVHENKFSWFLRRLKEIAHLRNNLSKNFGIRDQFNLNRKTTIFNRRLLIEIIYFTVKFFYSENFILKISRLQELSISSKKAEKLYLPLLEEDQLSLLFFSHQRPNFISPLVAIARRLRIPLSTFIFSWDNIPSKNRMAAVFDYYMVWSSLMKTELLDFYPSIDRNQVVVAGTPQFEIYSMDEFYIQKKEFYNRFDLDLKKKVMCYSCGDVTTSPNDTYYISLIAEAMLRNELVEDVNLIVRTSPAESHQRFVEIANSFPFIKWNYPKWELSDNDQTEQWAQRVPSREDCVDLRALVEHSDMNINLCSTMGLDFMHFDKPVINPVIGKGENGLFNDQKYLNYAHYKNVVESGAVDLAFTPEDLILLINKNLQHPNKNSLKRKYLLELQKGPLIPFISKHFINELYKIKV